ncbi:MAG: ethylammeline chlorohydrolase [Pseudonocardiales bacterium]|nr:amidohydrolase family protein [Pseudonocardiales bacterium]PZS30272.1 MAG: ethylammeline chlorohydrolase [Pseudonocardiales bacterium]
MRLTAPVVLPCDERCSVLRDAVVDVDGAGRIGYVGPSVWAPPAPGPELALTGILAPGLVNTHAHTAMTALRGLGGDLPLMRWLTEVIWPAEARIDAEDVRVGMLVGALEMLGAGITTSVEMYFLSDAVVDAVLAAGSRAVVTPGIIAVPGWDRLGTWQQMLDGISRWIDADGIRFGPGERIELGYGPHAAYTLPAEALAAAGAAARERGALLHIHVAETTGEDTAIREQHGSVPLLLERLGVLGSDDSGRGARVLAAHAVHLSDTDIAVLARYHAGVAHCPGSNSKLASGIARLVDLRAAGIAVGLGTDGPASHDDLNLWDDVRLAARLARLSTGDAAALTAAQALLMATRGGAAAIGRDDLGTVRPGAWADLVHIGADDPAFAAGLDVPDGQLLANLVWAAGARAVRDVWVAGERVLHDGVPTRVDPAEAHAALRSRVTRITGP